METKKLPGFSAALILLIAGIVFLGFKAEPTAKNLNKTINLKKGFSKKMITYNFKFFNGNEFVLIGSGGSTGTITTYSQGCVGGRTDNTGTCSGTFTISGSTCTINVSVTPSGYSLETYNGTSSYSTSALRITDCGN